MRGRALKALFLSATFLLLAGARLSFAGTFTISGQFLYEDRIWNQNGYTGTVQNLPIRRADVEVVKSPANTVMATGSTDANGNYSIVVSGQTGTINLYVRCKSSTNNAANYHITVVDNFTRTNGTVSLAGSVIWSIVTTTVAVNTGNPTFNAGSFLTQDGTGFGVAQAFNILDQGVDAFDYLASSGGIGRFPTSGEFIVYGWDGNSSDSEGSNYFWQGVFIQSVSTGSPDTDGWSDMVILHETGHWASDMFSNDHNTGGQHFIGDINQDPRLSYGEGYATFFAAEVREFRSTRLNGGGQPIDNHVSFYADLTVPPSLPNAGGLGFAYDVETGLFNTGNPIGQIGSACETNVTSAMWDVVDGTTTKDESPGVDDENQDDTGTRSWQVLQNYLAPITPPNWITVEDFYRGWFVVNGAGFQQAQMESAFVGLAKMPFKEDGLEQNDDIAHASTATPQSYSVAGGGGVVLNELDLGSEDKVELQNTGNTAVNLSNWTVSAYWTGGSLTYTIPNPFSLSAGSTVVLHEGGSAAQNSAGHLYMGGGISWGNSSNGAATLADNLGAAKDFVRWGGDTTPIPSGTTFTGSLASAPAGKNISRNANGTDTNAAADFSNNDPTMGWPNFTGVPERTIFPELDPDVYKLTLSAGSLIVVHVDAPHSAGEPRVELLDSGGNVLGASQALYGLPNQAELQFYTNAPLTAYVRLNHVGEFTDFAAFKPVFYLRPVQAILSPPVAVAGSPANASDVNDAYHMTWLNGGAYDQTKVYLDGALMATLAGSATSYDGTANRGLHTVSAQGVIGGNVTQLADALIFSGILDCTNTDGLETGTDGFILQGTWDRTTTLAKTGSYSLTDSPSGNYLDNQNVSAAVVEPTELTGYTNLQFDQICITEDDFDFGIVEISTDFGSHWTELVRYDMGDHPGWADGTASAGDWVHETVDLSAYAGKKVRIRFRLLTDAGVTMDGWYLDNITVSDSRCRSVTGVGDEPRPSPLLALRGSNPFRGPLQFSIHAPAGTAAEVDLYDVSGRHVQRIWAGNLPGDLDLSWDGRDAQGQITASGLYFLRARVGSQTRVVRAVKLP
jgi:hypothetical protein